MTPLASIFTKFSAIWSTHIHDKIKVKCHVVQKNISGNGETGIGDFNISLANVVGNKKATQTKGLLRKVSFG